MSGLDDAFFKLERGKQHFLDFQERVLKLYKEKRCQFDFKYYKHSGLLNIYSGKQLISIIAYCTSAPLITKSDAIIIGEGIQCFRSALDYLAWALCNKNSDLKTSQARQVQFPLAINSNSFYKQINQKLPNISNIQKIFIEKFQPYQNTDTGRTMEYLRILSDTDKHRIILPTNILLSDGNIKFRYDNKAQDLITKKNLLKFGQEIKDGTEIAEFVFACPPDSINPIDFNPTIRLDTAFPLDLIKPIPPNNIVVSVDSVLNRIVEVCFDILEQAKNYF